MLKKKTLIVIENEEKDGDLGELIFVRLKQKDPNGKLVLTPHGFRYETDTEVYMLTLGLRLMTRGMKVNRYVLIGSNRDYEYEVLRPMLVNYTGGNTDAI